jgi:hypothetical protein
MLFLGLWRSMTVERRQQTTRSEYWQDTGFSGFLQSLQANVEALGSGLHLNRPRQGLRNQFSECATGCTTEDSCDSRPGRGNILLCS